MKAWLYHHVATLGATLGRLGRSPLATLFNALVIGIALALPVALHVALGSLQTFAADFAASPQLSLFLARDAEAKDVARIEARLRNHPRVQRYRHVPRDEALKTLRAASALADVIDSLERNPLPDAFVIDAADGSPQALETLRAEFAQWPRIEHVQLDAAWAQRLDALLGLGRLAVILLGTLLAFALVAVTFNTIRLQVLTQRDEIEIVKLIGATDPFIRRPFLYLGALTGLAGGLAALLFVAAGVGLLNDRLAELSMLYGTPLRLDFPGLADSGAVLLFATGLGWIGARLSVGRHLARLAAA